MLSRWTPKQPVRASGGAESMLFLSGIEIAFTFGVDIFDLFLDVLPKGRRGYQYNLTAIT